MPDPPPSLSIEQVLMLVGRLDDAAGFDVPRERYRRFLREHAANPATVRALVEQCQHAPGEQHQRAFRDLVVHSGRLLGFDPFFGRYAAAEGAAPFDGRWHSRSRLDVIVDARTAPAPTASVENLVKSADALRAAGEATGRVAGLIVITSPAGRHRIDEAIAGAALPFPVGVVSIGSLLALADAVTAGNITHDHVVRVFESNLPGDVLVEMLERSAARPTTDESIHENPAGPKNGRSITDPAGPATGRSITDTGDLPNGRTISESDASSDTSYWIATVGQDHATRPEEFLELVVLRRHVFGIVDSATGRSTATPGDWVCFYVAGKGVVGHARIAALRAGGGGLRDAHRFRQLLQVEDVKLNLGAPVALDAETQLRLRTAGIMTTRPAPTLVRISRESFRVLTSPTALPLSG
jgi:hypothetical protein